LDGAERGLNVLLVHVAALRTDALLPYLCNGLLLHLNVRTDWRIAIGYLFGHGYRCLVLSSMEGWKERAEATFA
jgi:hypothetical protein